MIQKLLKYWRENFKKYTIGVYDEVCVRLFYKTNCLLITNISAKYRVLHSGHTSVSLNFGKFCQNYPNTFDKKEPEWMFFKTAAYQAVLRWFVLGFMCWHSSIILDSKLISS